MPWLLVPEEIKCHQIALWIKYHLYFPTFISHQPYFQLELIYAIIGNYRLGEWAGSSLHVVLWEEMKSIHRGAPGIHLLVDTTVQRLLISILILYIGRQRLTYNWTLSMSRFVLRRVGLGVSHYPDPPRVHRTPESGYN